MGIWCSVDRVILVNFVVNEIVDMDVIISFDLYVICFVIINGYVLEN